jgi:hypothetical protein
VSAAIELKQVILDRAGAAVEKNNFESGLQNVDVFYDVTFTAVPTPQGLQVGYWITLLVASPILGKALVHLLQMDNPLMNQQLVDKLVLGGLVELRNQRAKELSISNGTLKPGEPTS